MDEPTASLGAEEAARLERLVRRLTARGVAVVYISHRLDEVRRLAHRVTVLRDGRRIATRSAEGLDEAEMVRLMVGREIPPATLAPVSAGAAEVLRVESLSVADPNRPDGFRVRDVSLSVRRGEIVGPRRADRRRTHATFCSRSSARSAGTVTGRVVVDGREAPLGDPALGAREPASCCCPRSARRRRSSPTSAWARTSRSARSRRSAAASASCERGGARTRRAG